MARNKDGTYTGYIYKIDNLVNGKCYIGQTTTTIQHRWGQHKSDYNNPNPMYKAFKKYGIHYFKISEVANYTRDSKDELLRILNKKEIYYIKKFNSLTTGYGYNLSVGGNNVGIYNSFPIDVYDRNGILLFQCKSAHEASSIFSGYDISSILDCCNGISIPTIDYIFRFKGDSFNKYDIERSYKTKIYQFTLDGELIKQHASIKDAYLSVNGTRSGLQNMLKGKNKTYKGYYWNYENIFNYVPAKDVRIRIDQYSLNGKFIKTYDSAKDARVSVGATNSHSIIKVCQGQFIQAFGYIWRYNGDAFDKYQNFVKLKENNFSYGKPVDMYTLNKEYVRSFDSMKQAEEETGARASNISACCLGKVKAANGYIFRFKGDSIDLYDCNVKTRNKSVYVQDLSTKDLKIFPSKNKASKETGVGYHMIEQLCEGRNDHIRDGMIFLYEEDKDLLNELAG